MIVEVGQLIAHLVESPGQQTQLVTRLVIGLAAEIATAYLLGQARQFAERGDQVAVHAQQHEEGHQYGKQQRADLQASNHRQLALGFDLQGVDELVQFIDEDRYFGAKGAYLPRLVL